MKSKSKNFSIIDSDLTVEGTVSTTGRLIVKGTVRGELSGDNVIVAEEGAVYAKTHVKGMTIGGVFEGEIEAREQLVILSTGNCSGKVVCKDFVVEAGGILNADVTCTAVDKKRAHTGAPKAEKPVAAK